MVPMSPRRLRFLALVIASGLVAAACGGPTATTETTAPTTTATPAETTGDAPTAEDAADPGANAFLVDEFATVSGQSIDLADFQNQDVVLWLWAPW